MTHPCMTCQKCAQGLANSVMIYNTKRLKLSEDVENILTQKAGCKYVCRTCINIKENFNLDTTSTELTMNAMDNLVANRVLRDPGSPISFLEE